MNYIETLRDELHRHKEAFDRKLVAQPLLSREQRLAKWNLFLDEVRPLAEKLTRAEHHAEVLAARKLKNIRDYGMAVQA